MSELRNYFQENLSSFNDEIPRKGHEKRFENKLKKDRRLSLPYYFTSFLKIAGLVFLVFLSSLYIYDYVLIPSKNFKLRDLSKEYSEVEFYYMAIVNRKYKKLRDSNLFFDEAHKKMVFTELKELDSVYKGLQSELETNPGDERVVNAMIDYYKSKVTVINRVLLLLEETKRNKKVKRNETIEL